MKARWTHNSSYDSEITERRRGEVCNQMGEKKVMRRKGDKNRTR